ncbi:MAG: ISNCY family transposase [Tatlockia sp.]|nr:ISNCY family transposase [Tatlockia sp.]
MSNKELKRKAILERVMCGKMGLKDASILMEVSYRQAKRIKQRYLLSKDKGLLHGNRGKCPKNAISKEFKQEIISLYQQKYLGFGPTFAAEKLEEDDNISINAETLRLWLKNEGLWCRKRKHKVYRERRERRACFGDLLQIDGSIHAWFSDDRKDCLLNMVDDATGLTMALLDTGETTKILLTVLKKWIIKYGVPKAVYVDLKSVYVGSKQWMNKYDDDANEGFSVFQRVCRLLGIEIIRAYSAQAKGRVERKHAVFQDRLVKEITLYALKTIDQVNNHLENKFLDTINSKFAKSPRSLTNSHKEYPLLEDIDSIICWSYIRKLRNDWTIRFKNKYYQVEKVHLEMLKPEEEINIKIYLDDSMRFWFKNDELSYRLLEFKPEAPSKSKKYYKKTGYDSIQKSKIATQNKSKTPWSAYNPSWLKTTA